MSAAQAVQQSNRGPGGQYSFGTHAESHGITLSCAEMTHDQAALDHLARLVQEATVRHIEVNSYRSYPEREPDSLCEIRKDRAARFHSLPESDQRELVDFYELSPYSHLLEPNQTLGNDHVDVEAGLELAKDQIHLALVAQHEIAALGLLEKATMFKSDGGAVAVSLEQRGIRQRVNFGNLGSIWMTQHDPDEESSGDEYYWRERADTSSRVSQDSKDLRRDLAQHLNYSVLMDEASKTPAFTEHHEMFGEWNVEDKTVDFMVDQRTYQVDFSKDPMGMNTESGDELHPSMTAGFLSHLAGEMEHPEGGPGLVKDIHSVFERAAARLA